MYECESCKKGCTSIKLEPKVVKSDTFDVEEFEKLVSSCDWSNVSIKPQFYNTSIVSESVYLGKIEEAVNSQDPQTKLLMIIAELLLHIAQTVP